MTASLEKRFPDVHFFNPQLTEVQSNVSIGAETRVGSLTLIHSGTIIGSNSTIGSHCNICDSRIGDRVSIQTACHITRGVIIEDDVFIGPGVITANNPLTDYPVTSVGQSYPRICRGARVGAGSVILPGVVIGANAVIGAGSIVTRDVLPDTTVYGNPAKCPI